LRSRGGARVVERVAEHAQEGADGLRRRPRRKRAPSSLAVMTSRARALARPMSPSADRLFTTDDYVFLQDVVRAGYANPFTPACVEAERRALGAFFVDVGPAAAVTNRQRIASRLRPILDAARARLATGVCVEGADIVLYVEASLAFLRDTHGAS